MKCLIIYLYIYNYVCKLSYEKVNSKSLMSALLTSDIFDVDTYCGHTVDILVSVFTVGYSHARL